MSYICLQLNADASELFEEKSMDFTTNDRRKKRSLCQKCKGHGIEVFLKGQRKECIFTKCDCSAACKRPGKRIESRNSIARNYYASLSCPVQGMDPRGTRARN